MSERSLLWVSLPDQRPRRELHYMSLMPETHVTALAREKPESDVEWIPSTYRRPIKRFIEAGALAWVRQLADLDQSAFDWVATLELCSLVTGQASSWRTKTSERRPLQAVITWENLADQPIYKLPPYRQAFNSARDADLLLCMVDAAKDHLLANDFDPAKIRVVKPGVDTSVFFPAKAHASQPTVIFISPLAPNKGIDVVLDAMKIVQARIRDARLLVAGKGPMESLVTQAAADPNQNVEIMGSLDARGVGELLRSGATFVTAPRPTWKWEEQFGLAYVEAQACGLPVVTTKCGSNTEALAPGNDLLDEYSAEAIAERLIFWLENTEERNTQGNLNASWVRENHDLLTQCGRMGEAFAEIESLHGRFG